MPYIKNEFEAKNNDKISFKIDSDLLDSLVEGMKKIMLFYTPSDKTKNISQIVNFINDFKTDECCKQQTSTDKQKIETILKSVIRGIKFDIYNRTDRKPKKPLQSINISKQEKINDLIRCIDNFVSYTRTDFNKTTASARYTRTRARYLDHIGFINYIHSEYSDDKSCYADELIEIYKKILFSQYMNGLGSIKNISLFSIRKQLLEISDRYSSIIENEYKVHEEINIVNITYIEEISKCLNILLDFIELNGGDNTTIEVLKKQYKQTKEIQIFEAIEKDMPIILLYIEYFYPVYEKYKNYNTSLYEFIDSILYLL